MSNKIAVLIVFISVCIASLCIAQESESNIPIPVVQQKKITKIIESVSIEMGKNLSIDQIKASPIPGLLQITSGLNVFYISEDGQYLAFGEILDTSKNQSTWNITEQEVRQLRMQALATVKETDMVIFPSLGKKIGTVTVFTDLDCGYCHKMQKNIKKYNNLGIEVRYLAFPRSGPNTPSFNKAITVWCSKDKAHDYALASDGQELAKNLCTKNPVTLQFELGRKMGINGTPTFILDNGVIIGGLVDPQTLVQMFREM